MKKRRGDLASRRREKSSDPLVVRLVLLLLMTACAYGVPSAAGTQRQVEEMRLVNLGCARDSALGGPAWAEFGSPN